MRTLHVLVILALASAGWCERSWANAPRTQTIQLKAGWNAVYLEVQPTRSKPAEVFAGLPVERVTCFVVGRQEAQFLRMPGDAPWREEGWVAWHAPSKPEAFLSNLFDIQALRPLLVLASADATWTVTGEARSMVLEWHPNTCTFTGLPVDPAAPPTFAQFFEGSAAHQRMRIYRLTAGLWKLVGNPATEKVRSGEAYWIQTDGASTYQGLLRVKLPVGGDLDFDLRGGDAKLEFANESKTSAARVTVEVTRVEGALPLELVMRDLAKRETTRRPILGAIELPALPVGATQSLQVSPSRDGMKNASGTALLRITDGRGTQHWVPVRARREPPGVVSTIP